MRAHWRKRIGPERFAMGLRVPQGWVHRGKPEHTRFGLTVTAKGERVWLDDPADSWAL
ncbi:hypothetical protein [Streptomyces sp. bgisy084]|uniref:hypothetical protein n=1 Tax=unclassified Streptomyces TaxID=2593676 RepID=UPI003D755F81